MYCMMALVTFRLFGLCMLKSACHCVIWRCMFLLYSELFSVLFAEPHAIIAFETPYLMYSIRLILCEWMLWFHRKSVSLLPNVLSGFLFSSLLLSDTCPGLQRGFPWVSPQVLSCGHWKLQSHPVVLGGPASNRGPCPHQVQTLRHVSQVGWAS